MHGYLADSKSFSYQLDYFGKDFDVFAPDLKGFGKNKDMPYPYSLDDYILDLKEYMYKKNIRKPSVVAHSFGGRIVVKIAGRDQNFFDKLVLAGSAGLKPKPTVKKVLKKGAFSLLKRFIPKEKLTSFYSSDYQSLNETMKKSFINIVNEHLDCYLKDITNQTLLVFGDLDKQTPLYMAKKFNRCIKNSSLSIYKGAGHFAFIDKPLKFNLEVREFLLS